MVWIVGPLVGLTDRPAGRGPARDRVGALDHDRRDRCADGAASSPGSAWRAQRGNAAVVNQLHGAAAPAIARRPRAPTCSRCGSASRRRSQTLRRARFGAGGGVLAGLERPSSHGKRYLYELPWYLIIGAPGSGKTTALRQLGPQVPARRRRRRRRGARRRRHAQLRLVVHRPGRADRHRRPLHHAGQRPRATTARPGAASWRCSSARRPRQPLNGVLVTVSVTDLLTRTPPSGASTPPPCASACRSCTQHLGIRFPIYLLVTKCDLLAGFIDYFATLDKDQRATPWGATFPRQGQLSAEPAALRPRVRRARAAPRATASSSACSWSATRSGARASTASRAVRGAARRPAGIPRAGLLAVAVRGRPAAARRVLRQRHAGRHADRPRARLDRAQLPPRARDHRRRNQASGTQLLPAAPARRGGVRRERPGRHRPEVGAAPHRRPSSPAMRRSPCSPSARSPPGGELREQPALRRRGRAARRRGAPAGAEHAQPRLARPAADPARARGDAQPRAAPATEVPWTLGFGLYQGPKLDSAARGSYQRMLVDAMLPRIGAARRRAAAPGEQRDARRSTRR